MGKPIGEKNRLGGFADDLMGRRAEIGVEARLNSHLGPRASDAENLRGRSRPTRQEWDVADEAESRRRKNLPLPELANLTQRRNGPNGLESDHDMKARLRSPEQTDTARKMGDAIDDLRPGHDRLRTAGRRVRRQHGPGCQPDDGGRIPNGPEPEQPNDGRAADRRSPVKTGHMTKEQAEAVRHEPGLPHQRSDQRPLSGAIMADAAFLRYSHRVATQRTGGRYDLHELWQVPNIENTGGGEDTPPHSGNTRPSTPAVCRNWATPAGRRLHLHLPRAPQHRRPGDGRRRRHLQ